jgi:hypothetical protein
MATYLGSSVHQIFMVYEKYKLQVNIDRPVGTEMGYGLDGRRSFPGRSKFLFFSKASRPIVEPTSLQSNGYLRFFLRPGLEVDHSTSSSAEIKNAKVTLSLPYKSSRYSV